MKNYQVIKIYRKNRNTIYNLNEPSLRDDLGILHYARIQLKSHKVIKMSKVK